MVSTRSSILTLRAEPIRIFILDYFAYELRAALAEPFKRLVDVVHGEHAEVA
jgi:hypothetical protein